MGPPSYMRSVVDRNVTQRTSIKVLFYWIPLTLQACSIEMRAIWLNLCRVRLNNCALLNIKPQWDGLYKDCMKLHVMQSSPLPCYIITPDPNIYHRTLLSHPHSIWHCHVSITRRCTEHKAVPRRARRLSKEGWPSNLAWLDQPPPADLNSHYRRSIAQTKGHQNETTKENEGD
jgi:hypothetical protein